MEGFPLACRVSIHTCEALTILVASLYPRTPMGHFGKPGQRRLRRQVAPVALQFTFLTNQRSLAEKPALSGPVQSPMAR